MLEHNESPEKDTSYYEHYNVIVDKGQAPLRIDKFLINRIQNVSRNKLQNAAKADSILVNGVSVKSNYKVKPGDEISVVMAEPPREYEIIPENIPLDIFHEDEDIIIINKSVGLVVHPGVGNFTGTLVHGLAYHFANQQTESKDVLNIKNDNIRPGLVHRIDKNTSGLIVIAKNDYAMTFLAKQFFDHSIQRTYTALVWGNIEKDSGTITGNIGRSTKDRKVFSVYEESDKGKHAVTHYKVLERFGYTTLIECRLETGRTHQIRVHMKHIGHPIFNDDNYGGNKIIRGNTQKRYQQFIKDCFSIMERQALHAKSLGFIHPRTRSKMLFDSELPDDFKQVVELCRQYYAALTE